jgi:predicted nucleic acid-binding protein
VKLVIDASVAVEYLLRTPLGARLAERIEQATTAAPELIDAEVLAVLRREVLAGRLGARRAAEALADLRDWDLERVPHRPLLEDAWALRGNVTAYDALYLAVAARYDAPVLTAHAPRARAPTAGLVIATAGGPPARR